MKNFFLSLLISSVSCNQLSFSQTLDNANQTVFVYDSIAALNQARKDFLEASYLLDGTNQVAPSEIIKQGLNEARNLVEQGNRTNDYNWCSQGPDNFSGNIQVLLIDNTNVNHIYAGAERGGLFESFDKGEHWNPVPNWDKHMLISALAQGIDGTVYVGTGQKMSYNYANNIGGNGVYFKNPNDSAAEWSLVPGTNSWNIQCIATNSVNNKIFIGAQNGLFTWNKDLGGAPQSAISNSNICNEVKVSSDGQVVLCRLGSNPVNGLFQSEDGGTSFTALFGNSNDGLITPGTAMYCKFGFSQNPVNGAYVCYIIGGTTNSVTTYRSDNNGSSWKQVSILEQNQIGNFNNSFYAACLWVNPTNHNQLLMGTGNLFLGTYNPNSEFLGWEQLSTLVATPNPDLYLSVGQFDIQVDEQNKIYIATYEGLFTSQNFGASFQRTGYNLHNTVINNVASGGDGKLVAGALLHGALFNNLQNLTPKSFKNAVKVDHFDVAMSSFNTDISFVGHVFGSPYRLITNGSQFTYDAFVPNYLGYGLTGSHNGSADFHYRTPLAFAEYFDLNSKDSVTYLPTSNTPAGTLLNLASLTQGKYIEHTTNQTLYFDALVNHDPNLTLLDYLITNANNGQIYQLYPLTWSFLSGSGDPEVGDVILVTAPFEEIIEIGAVSTYNRYFAQHPITGKLLDMNVNTQMSNVAWDTLRVADPYQSIFVTHTRKNGGELYATRDALRTSLTPKWSKIVEGIGEMSTGEIAISANLEHIYVGTSTGLWRVDGYADAYSTQIDYGLLTDLRVGAAPLISKTQIHNEAVSGMSVNPNDAGDILITLSGIGTSSKLKRSSAANTETGTGSFESIFGNLPTNLAYNDALIDVYDDDKLLVANTFGIWSSNDGGSTWSSANAGMGSVSVSRIIQNWRVNEPNTTKPGEIYLATLGAGIFSTGECTDFVSVPNFELDLTQLELVVYPNPSKEKVNLKISSGEYGAVDIQVVSISGQKVYSQSTFVQARTQEIEINLNEFNSGFYFVHLTFGDKRLVSKFIKTE